MILLLIIYLLFQLAYGQWGADSVTWDVVFFSFQWGWVGSVAMYHFIKSKQLAYLFISLLFAGSMVNELLCLNMDIKDYKLAANPDKPLLTITIVAAVLFILHEIMQWKRKSA